MSRAKEETKSMTGNLLVVAVLVAGVTFAGVIQLPQFGAFLFSVRIALIGSHGWLSTIINKGVAVVFPSIILLFVNPFLLRALLHYIYYSLFLLFIYISGWRLPNKLSDLKRKLSDLKKKHNLY